MNNTQRNKICERWLHAGIKRKKIDLAFNGQL